MRRKPENFEKFYYKKVALGEGCGCAERVIDNHELERLAAERRLFRSGPGPLARLWARLTTRRGALTSPSRSPNTGGNAS